MATRRPRTRTAVYLAGATLAFAALSALVVTDATARPTAPGTTGPVASVVPYLIAFPLAFLSILALAAAILVAAAPRHRLPRRVHRILAAGFTILLATTLLAFGHALLDESTTAATHPAWRTIADHVSAIMITGVGLGFGLLVLGITATLLAVAPIRKQPPAPARYAKSPYGRVLDDRHWPPTPPE